MMAMARIKLSSPNIELLNKISNTVIDMAQKTGIKHSGVIPLPTKKMVIPVRKSPCGGGTESYEKWQMRVHKRIIDINSDERLLKRLMHLELPDDVYIEIEMK
ncbi:MAG: 30S ribosomal protein S10 [Candidatus ainarchaeum sp.]|nr:30S ribosomal protein S10 [Candidatus ainarchaeum sp.]